MAPHLEVTIKSLVTPPLLATTVLRFEGVTRRYGATLALDDVSFQLQPGSLTALVGENGSGKSTLLRLGACLEAPTRGRVDVERGSIAWLGQEPGLYGELTVRENLRFAAEPFGRAGEIEAAAARVAIAHKLDDRARHLSRGERQRAAIARAWLGGALMLLDEPTTALDAAGAESCAQVLCELRGARTMLVATHDEDLVKRADRVLRLSHGRLVAS